MFPSYQRCLYGRNQLGDVICQLRFPVILSIEAKPPAEFQDLIRDSFPKFQAVKEVNGPKITGAPGNFSVENQPPTTNYQFLSEDNTWRVNLTTGFISLSCSRYTSWEAFAKKLDKPLAAFIQTYKPAYFERVGLRYLNFISRNDLSLENVPFQDLIEPAYLGILSRDDIHEKSALRSSVDAEIALAGGCHAKIHAGPGMVKRSNITDNEVKFIFDQDLFKSGNIPVSHSAETLEALHSHAYSLFRGAITERLHDAMEPID